MSQRFKNTQRDDSDLTGLDLDSVHGKESVQGKVRQSWFRLSLFWRTFILLSILLVGSVLAWLQTYRAVQGEPDRLRAVEKIASSANFLSLAMARTDISQQLALMEDLQKLEKIKIHPRLPSDRVRPFPKPYPHQAALDELRALLPQDAVLAQSVNDEHGLWIGQNVSAPGQQRSVWICVEVERINPSLGYGWMAWLVLAVSLSIVGIVLIARLINRPFQELSFAASRIREGDYNTGSLNDQTVGLQEREVHEDFNRMAVQLAKIEQDRAVMLAGISHDLRTPLARLRLETEMSVSNEDAKAFMVADIEQLDAIIDKFMDYARPGEPVNLQTVSLNDVISQCVVLAQQNEDIQFRLDLPTEFWVLAEEVDLRRVVGNLIENARKYGKTPNTGITQVDIAARERYGQVIMKLLDHGTGVQPELLRHLTKPFYRADEARTSATGAGLGLAIVEKTVQRMGGQLGLANSIHGGLIVTLKLQVANSV